MKIVVTGSAGHLGTALVRSLRREGAQVLGIDITPSPETDVVGSITDRALVDTYLRGAGAVLHAATLHKPHVETHSRQDFVDTNITGTLTLLEAAVEAQVGAFVYTSTTSTFGDSLVPPAGAPAAWITEEVPLAPKNIYGVTKSAAEDLCLLFHRNQGLPVLVLRTSRFFPEADDHPERRLSFDDTNLKVIELLYRRVDVQDVVSAHQAAMACARAVGFGRFIVSATSPFRRSDVARLRGRAGEVLRERVPRFEPVFAAQGWQMLDDIDRVYVNDRARQVLGWKPEFDFARALDDLAHGRDPRSPLAREIGRKGYHPGRVVEVYSPEIPGLGGAQA
jgi:UDP-glucose 4-epimerase